MARRIAAFLCIAIGVFPQYLYAILPYKVDFVPNTTTHVVTQLQLLFFSALGFNGEDILTADLAERNGPYDQYHHGDFNALHVSYFRRNPIENEFQTCNLRKSYGFHMVAQGADPLPTLRFAASTYRVNVIKCGAQVSFRMSYKDETIDIFLWEDDGQTYGPILGEGKIGFRQMTPLIAEYSNLEVKKVEVA